MHICFVCVEIFAWGKYGGFGRATRTIGRELVKRGIQVTAIVPRRQNQAAVEWVDGIRVLGFNMRNIPEMLKIYKDCDADIYHSEEPSFGTYLVQRFHPDKKHIITFRDTRLFSDWITELRLPSLSKPQVLFNWFYEDNFFVRHAVRKADKTFIAAKLLQDRVIKKYRLRDRPEFLPTPVLIPEKIEKDTQPTVCYIARWDRRKRPVLLIELAKSFPYVHFIIAGSSRDKKFDAFLRGEFSKLPNVELTGFINQFESAKLSEILSKSWILINTAAREGLPNSFIEACAYKCAILSAVNPDEFSSRFGYHSSKDDFFQGLDFLLQNDTWRKLGENGYKYVKDTFNLETAINQHIKIYNDQLGINGST